MKKILVALMAVLVMVSCGGKDSAKKITVGEFTAELAGMFKEANAVVCNTTDCDKVIEAMTVLKEKQDKLVNDNRSTYDEWLYMDPSDVEAKYPEQAPEFYAEKKKCLERLWSIEDNFYGDNKEKLQQIKTDMPIL